MKKFVLRTALAALLMPALFACTEEPRNTEPLVDPWLRERTPVNLRLESQIGAAVISDDWRNDGVGSVVVNLITGGLDMSAVNGPGSTLDLSSGSASFVVTAHNGETRTYTVTYTQFKDPLEGTYTFTPVGGILDGSAPPCAFIIVGGWDGAVVRSTVMDKWWHWGSGYMPTDEDDNTLSFRLEGADPETGATYGTLVNTPGENGLYANYVYNNSIDVNDKYRIFPAGKSRWGKPGVDSKVLYIFDYADEGYTTPLYGVELIEAGNHEYAGVNFDVPNLAFGRSFPGPFDVIDYNWPDTRWFTDNVRNTFWLVKKDADTPIADHSDYLAD